jgi:hypothetical protein
VASDSLRGRFFRIRDFRQNLHHFRGAAKRSFSEDGGKTWEVNWITDQVRVGK